MDTIILAAGRNQRLRGVVPAYLKPLILMNGQPLIKTLVTNSLKFGHNVTLVLSQHNVTAVLDVLQGQVDMQNVNVCIQADPRGPAEAVRVGLPYISTPATIIVCGDNIIPVEDIGDGINTFQKSDRKTTITIAKLPGDQAERFTRVTETRLIEREPIGAALGDYRDDLFNCWLGPVIVDTVRLRQAYDNMQGKYPELLSTVLNEVGPFVTYHGRSQDVGVPEALL